MKNQVNAVKGAANVCSCRPWAGCLRTASGASSTIPPLHNGGFVQILTFYYRRKLRPRGQYRKRELTSLSKKWLHLVPSSVLCSYWWLRSAAQTWRFKPLVWLGSSWPLLMGSYVRGLGAPRFNDAFIYFLPHFQKCSAQSTALLPAPCGSSEAA